MSHTPGPWRIVDGTEVRGADGTIVCNTADYRVPAPAAEAVAVPDAALIAAAPDLLAALNQIAVLAEYGTTGPGKCGSRALNAEQATSLRLAVSDIARAAIARATGQA